MNILMLVPGGVGRGGRYAVIPTLLGLIRGLAQRHQVSVIALAQEPEPCEYELAGARIYNLGRTSKLRGWGFAQRLHRLQAILARQEHPFDLVHSIWIGPCSTLAVLAARRLGAPVVVSLGGGEMVAIQDIRYGGARVWSGRQQVRFALRAADAVTAGSHYALGPILQHRPDALWIPLFPEASGFAGLAPRAGSPQPRILTVSSVNHVKDPPTLLRALGVVAERFPDVQLDWVGEDTLQGEVGQLAASLALAERVTFHGFQTYDRLPQFYARARLYVQASRHESQGVAVCEAAAAGLPIVGTRVGLVAELAPAAAYATPPGDYRALADGILRVLSSPVEAAELADNARRWAARHPAAWTAERFQALYEGLVGQRTVGEAWRKSA